MGEERDWLPYTDLASEASAALRGQSGEEIPGVSHQDERHDGYTISRVHVFSPEGAQVLGKQQGHYVTIDAPGLRERDPDLQSTVKAVLTAELNRLLQLDPRASVLVVGLGNALATPDALGPRAVDQILVTRHLKDFLDPDTAAKLRPVAAISPGVLGSTGIETGEVIRSLVQHVHPDAVIVIDALAAASIERIGTTVQFADTGIHPGSGLGSRRVGLNQETLGVPVIAVGVPTVVHASTIVNDVITYLATHLPGSNPFFRATTQFTLPERRGLIEEVLASRVGELVVTPKDIDEMVEDTADLIAEAVNDLLHSNGEAQGLLRYL